MDLETIGIVLYWCEGSKNERDRRVEFVNSDARMVSIFMNYLRSKSIDESRLRIRMTIHIQDDEKRCREYWKKVTSLEDANFLSTIVKRQSLVRKPLQFGTVTIRYNSVGLLRQINSDILKLIETIVK